MGDGQTQSVTAIQWTSVLKIFIATTPPQAHIVCEMLRSEGIACEVRGEGLFGLQGEIPFGEEASPYVWLTRPEQKQAALALIDDFQQDTPDNMVWVCPTCQEENDGHFQLCWQCEHTKPA